MRERCTPHGGCSASTLDRKATLSADDALALRRVIYGQSLTVDQTEAEALFQLNADAGTLAPEWCALFIEAMTDFVVRQQDPAGYVDDAKAGWLVDAVARYGRIRGDEVEMLIHVLEEADQSPEKLSAYVLSMVKALALSRLNRTGAVTPLDIDRLRRVIFAKGGEANVAVTREEAEALFDINDALAGTAANAAWTDFFVRAVANAVLFEPIWAPDKAAELKREKLLEDTSIHPLARIKAALGDMPGSEKEMVAALHEVAHGLTNGGNFDLEVEEHDLAPLNDRFAADEALEAAAETVTADEAHWLAERIGRDGRYDANEHALIDYLRANARAIDPSLPDLLAQLEARSTAVAPAGGAPAPAPMETAHPTFGHRVQPLH